MYKLRGIAKIQLLLRDPVAAALRRVDELVSFARDLIARNIYELCINDIIACATQSLRHT